MLTLVVCPEGLGLGACGTLPARAVRGRSNPVLPERLLQRTARDAGALGGDRDRDPTCNEAKGAVAGCGAATSHFESM